MKKNIWTIGHSNKSFEEFVQTLKSFDIRMLVDIRRFPGSRKYPHFNKSSLEGGLKKEGISYIHLESLGGRRRPRPDSRNDRWTNEAFRGYADYMETEEFKNAIGQLKSVALAERSAIMCSEVLWWQCHRSLVSDQLKSEEWTVIHIMGIGKSKEHPYSPAAQVVQGKLDYSKDQE